MTATRLAVLCGGLAALLFSTTACTSEPAIEISVRSLQSAGLESLVATWGPLVQDRYATSVVAGRACSSTSAASAMAAAKPFFNAPEASICADDGAMQIDWRFALPGGAPVDSRQRLLSLAIVTPELPGNRAWWI